MGNGARMRAKMLMAEAASMHEDRTASIHRAGISEAIVPSVPILFKGSLYIRFEFEHEETRHHEIVITGQTDQGENLFPPHRYVHEAKADETAHAYLLTIVVAFKALGQCSFAVAVNGEELDRWPFNVRQEGLAPNV